MKIIAITGGIGSGKSLVSRVFSTYGIPVYNTDMKAKWLMNNNYLLRKDITNLFGERAYENGLLNREYIASVVFSSSDKLQKLNAIVHPAVCIDLKLWANSHNQPMVAVETALLLESGLLDSVDKIVTVFAPDDLRAKRAAQRDTVSEKIILNRMKHQTPQDKLISIADFVINNDGIMPLLPQIENIINTIYTTPFNNSTINR